MNLQEGLATSKWLFEKACMDEQMSPQEIKRVKGLKDLVYYLHAAAGVAEIRLEAFDMGQAQFMQEHEEVRED